MTIEDLRKTAAHLWRYMTRAFGDADHLARAFHSRMFCKNLTDWVSSLERLVRRLVFLAALAIDPATLKLGEARGGSRHAPAPFTARRSFRTLPRNSVARPGARYYFGADDADEDEPNDKPLRTASLARRVLMLRHALRHTDRYARRLAHRLARLHAANGPRPVAVDQFLIPFRFLTSGQDAIHDAMLASTPTVRKAIANHGPRWVEPG